MSAPRYTPGVYPFVDGLWCDAIPRSDLGHGQPLGCLACSIADVSPPDARKTKRPQADVNAESLDLRRSHPDGWPRSAANACARSSSSSASSNASRRSSRPRSPEASRISTVSMTSSSMLAVEVQATARALKDLRGEDLQPRRTLLASLVTVIRQRTARSVGDRMLINPRYIIGTTIESLEKLSTRLKTGKIINTSQNRVLNSYRCI